VKILLHDYCGHPFQVQLSKELASLGREVLHIYNGSNPTTPKGALADVDETGALLRIQPITLPREIKKDNLIARWQTERLYGRYLADEIEKYSPDVVLTANTPLDALSQLSVTCGRQNVPWVFWLQDLIGVATKRILAKRLPFVGNLIGNYYERKERDLLGQSSAVVGITEAFRPMVEGVAGACGPTYQTIENWAPLDEIIPSSKQNAWADTYELGDKFVFLYSGTLGFKHNPQLLIDLARRFSERDDVRVVVNSQGHAADWLKAEAERQGLGNIIVNPFQPYEEMSEVLGAADVLVTILEPDAGAFSVPSKVLSCHCAQRALLLAVPADNLAAQIVRENGSGLVCDPGDSAGFLSAAEVLYKDANSRDEMGRKARAYAEATFDIERIAARFEKLLMSVVVQRKGGAVHDGAPEINTKQD
jgi:glycosyltransferase involved in cell wall biosynthesis